MTPRDNAIAARARSFVERYPETMEALRQQERLDNELAAASGHRRHWRRMPQQDKLGTTQAGSTGRVVGTPLADRGQGRLPTLCRIGLHKWTSGLDVDFGAYQEKHCRCGAKALVPTRVQEEPRDTPLAALKYLRAKWPGRYPASEALLENAAKALEPTPVKPSAWDIIRTIPARHYAVGVLLVGVCWGWLVVGS